jgi:hypothetical protein
MARTKAVATECGGLDEPTFSRLSSSLKNVVWRVSKT